MPAASKRLARFIQFSCPAHCWRVHDRRERLGLYGWLAGPGKAETRILAGSPPPVMSAFTMNPTPSESRRRRGLAHQSAGSLRVTVSTGVKSSAYHANTYSCRGQRVCAMCLIACWQHLALGKGGSCTTQNTSEGSHARKTGSASATHDERSNVRHPLHA